MAQRLSGIWFKLVDQDGCYLGILMVPEDIALGMEGTGRYRCARRVSLPSVASWMGKATKSLIPEPTYMIDFVAADHLMQDAIMVFGITLSDLNKERGFAFIPSAEYLQRGPSLPKVEPVTAQPVDSRFQVLDFT